MSDGQNARNNIGHLCSVEGVFAGNRAKFVPECQQSSPILDSRLPDGSRVAAVIPPCSLKGVTLTIRFGVPTDIESVVKSRGEPTVVVSGELNPVFQGIYSSRIEIKQWYREMERLLTTAEKLATVADWLGVPVDRQGLEQAWEPVLFNQTHDQASGVMVDKVYADAVRGYEFSQRLGHQMVGTWWDGVTSKIDTTGD